VCWATPFRYPIFLRPVIRRRQTKPESVLYFIVGHKKHAQPGCRAVSRRKPPHTHNADDSLTKLRRIACGESALQMNRLTALRFAAVVNTGLTSCSLQATIEL